MSYSKLFLKHGTQKLFIQKNQISEWLEDIEALSDKKIFLLDLRKHINEIKPDEYPSVDAKEMATQGIDESIEFINKELHEIIIQESLTSGRAAKEMTPQGANGSIVFINKNLNEIPIQKKLPSDRQDDLESNSDSKTKQKKVSESGFTLARQVLCMMLIQHHFKLNKSQDKKPLQDFIAMMTGKTYRTIGDMIKSFTDNDMFCHKTPDTNYEDYSFILPFFQKLEQKEIADLITQKIKQSESMFAKK